MKHREPGGSASAAAREVEAILLVSGRPVPVRALAAATERANEEVEAAISEIEGRYGPERSGAVLRRVGGGWQLATSPEHSAAVERFRKEARPSPLSGAAHEVLACVLYLGPMTRAAVSKVRGVNSDAVARSLIERGLLAESGFDADAPGTPALLDLTEEFHIASGSSTRDDFPPLDSLVTGEELDRVRERVIAPGSPDGTASDGTASDGTASSEDTPDSAAPDSAAPDDGPRYGTAPNVPASGLAASCNPPREASAPGDAASGSASP